MESVPLQLDWEDVPGNDVYQHQKTQQSTIASKF